VSCFNFGTDPSTSAGDFVPAMKSVSLGGMCCVMYFVLRAYIRKEAIKHSVAESQRFQKNPLKAPFLYIYRVTSLKYIGSVENKPLKAQFLYISFNLKKMYFRVSPKQSFRLL
jgi:hypothetical protein